MTEIPKTKIDPKVESKTIRYHRRAQNPDGKSPGYAACADPERNPQCGSGSCSCQHYRESREPLGRSKENSGLFDIEDQGSFPPLR